MIAFGFDFDHTLGVDHALERAAFYRLAEELSEPIAADDVAHRAQIDTLLADFRAGTIALDEAVDRFVASLHGLHVSPRKDADRYREICYGLVGEHVEPLPGARELFAHLSGAGIPFAILTNGWSPLQEKKIAAIGYAGPILVSDAIGVSKPDKRAFALLAQTLAVAPEHIWYVGDNPVADVGGALAAGLRAVWVDRGELTYPQSLPPPTLRVADLRELIEKVPGELGTVEKRG